MKAEITNYRSETELEAIRCILNSRIYLEYISGKPLKLIIAELLNFEQLLDFAGSYANLQTYADTQSNGRELAAGLIKAFAEIGITVPNGVKTKDERRKTLTELFHTGTSYHENDYYAKNLQEVEQFLLNYKIVFPNKSAPNSLTNKYLSFCTYLHYLLSMLTYSSYNAHSKEHEPMRCLNHKNY